MSGDENRRIEAAISDMKTQFKCIEAVSARKRRIAITVAIAASCLIVGGAVGGAIGGAVAYAIRRKD